MFVSSDKKLEMLNDHYKDTFSHLVGYRKQRDRLLLYLMTVVVIMILYQFFPEETITAISEIVSKKIGVNLGRGSVLVYILPMPFFVILGQRYWQVWHLIESQYDYLEKLEEELASLFSSGVLLPAKVIFPSKGRDLSIWSHKFYDQCFLFLLCNLVFLGATFGFRHYGFSMGWLICCIGSIIFFFYWNFKATLKKIWTKIRKKRN